jgi:hypothetical protein
MISLPPKKLFRLGLTRHFANQLKNDLGKERVFTLPNTISMSRFIVSPFMAYSIIQGNFVNALGALFYCGTTDFVTIQVIFFFILRG